MRASLAIFKATGIDLPEGGTSGTCRICGDLGVGENFKSWVRPTFTDHDKLLSGDIICHACLFSFAERSELLAKRVGKDKPQRMRNYSHFVINGEWIPLSKGDKDGIIRAFSQSPQVAVVAMSGQKHLIFRASCGWWQIEETSILPFRDMLFYLLGIVEVMYSDGVTKGEIKTGRYNQNRIMDIGLNRFVRFENELKPVRGTLPFDLAIFLSQKRELDEYGRLPARIPYSLETAHSALARDTGRLQTEIRPKHLASVRGQSESGRIHHETEQIRQLDLFEASD